MITLDQVAYVTLESSCGDSYPCRGHHGKVFTTDGRNSGLDTLEITAIVMNIANEKINPNGGWEAVAVKRHFARYYKMAKPIQEVLNTLFPNKKNLNFDLEAMFNKAEEFSTGDHNLLVYIVNILKKDVFLDNPKAYLNDWKEERGNTEEFRYLEDMAMGFFQSNFK